MLEDPGEKTDIAKEKPDIVKQLSTAYGNWFHDVTKAGFAKPRIPVGYEEQNPVRFYAPQASFTGNIHFFAGAGFANDWLTGWTNTTDKISFELDVVRGGLFEVELGYACSEGNAGAKIRISDGKNSVEKTVTAARAENIPLPHRDGGKDTYVNRDWEKLELGKLYLEQGPATLTIEALKKPGKEILELKHVQLKRIE